MAPLLAFCLGALAMKLAGAVLPPLFEDIFDYAIYGGIALSGAIAYRRFVRRAIEDRRRVQARRAESADQDASG